MVRRALFDEEAFYVEIGKSLKQIRKLRRMTQEDLARLVDLERTSIANIERGKQKTPLHILYALCFALRIEITKILPSVDETIDVSAKTTKLDSVDIGSTQKMVPSSVALAVNKLVQ